jgi:hypothetical protein
MSRISDFQKQRPIRLWHSADSVDEVGDHCENPACASTPIPDVSKADWNFQSALETQHQVPAVSNFNFTLSSCFVHDPPSQTRY